MKAYLFDLDGTLFDSMHVWDDIGRIFLKAHHIPIPDDLDQRVATMSFAQSAEYFIELGTLSLSVQEVCAAFYQLVKERYLHEVVCKPFVNAFLKECKHKQIKMGILTALDRNIAEACLKRNQIDCYFDSMLTCDEFGKGKDDPAVFYESARILQVKPEDITVFEDALYCMKSATAAGMHVIGVFDDTQVLSKEEIEQYCDRFIYSFKEVLQEDKK